MYNLPCLVHMLCLLCLGFTEDFSTGLADVVEDTYGDDESWQVLLIHLKVHAENPLHALRQLEAHSTIMETTTFSNSSLSVLSSSPSAPCRAS